MANTNYNRGEMDIDAQSDTFGGFMSYSVYGGAAIIVMLLFPILVFAVNLSWPVAMLTTVVLGIIIGIALKFKAQWYAVLIASAVFLSIVIGLLLLIF